MMTNIVSLKIKGSNPSYSKESNHSIKIIHLSLSAFIGARFQLKVVSNIFRTFGFTRRRLLGVDTLEQPMMSCLEGLPAQLSYLKLHRTGLRVQHRVQRFLSGFGGSGTVSLTVAPPAQELSDVLGAAPTVGGAATVAKVFSAGVGVYIPLEGPAKNFSITGSGGFTAGYPVGEGHLFYTDTTIDVYAESSSSDEAWNEAKESGMFKGMNQDIIDHFREVWTSQFSEQD